MHINMKSLMDHGREKRKKKREDVVKKKQKRKKERVKGRSYKHLCPLRSVHEFRQRESQRKIYVWVLSKGQREECFGDFFFLPFPLFVSDGSSMRCLSLYGC